MNLCIMHILKQFNLKKFIFFFQILFKKQKMNSKFLLLKIITIIVTLLIEVIVTLLITIINNTICIILSNLIVVKYALIICN